jgi:cytochrome P450
MCSCLPSHPLLQNSQHKMLLAVLACAALVYIGSLLVFNQIHRSFYPGRRPPLVCGWIPYIGVALQYAVDPYEYVRSVQAKKGDIITLYIMGQFITYIGNPHNVQKVYAAPKNFDFHEVGFALGTDIFGVPQQSVVRDEVVHKALSMLVRKLQNEDLEIMTQRAKKKLEHFLLEKNTTEWKEDNMYEWVNKTIISVTSNTFFGDQFNPVPVTETFLPFDRSIPILAARLPQIVKTDAMKKRSDFMMNFITKPSEEATSLMKERFALYSPLFSEEQMGNLMGVIVWASLSNTANTTFWCMYYLMNQPKHVLQEIITEIEEKMPKIEGSRLPDFSYDSLTELTKLDAFIDEILRLHFATLSGRMAVNDVKFTAQDGRIYNIPNRSLIMLVNSHRDEEVFENPTQFQYDRFHNKNQVYTKNDKPVKLSAALIPWGGGSAQCPGKFRD